MSTPSKLGIVTASGRDEGCGIQPRQRALRGARRLPGRRVVDPHVSRQPGAADADGQARRILRPLQRVDHAARQAGDGDDAAPAQLAGHQAGEAVLVDGVRQPLAVGRGSDRLHVVLRLLHPVQRALGDVVVRQPGEVALVVGGDEEALPVRRPLDAAVAGHLLRHEERVQLSASATPAGTGRCPPRRAPGSAPWPRRPGATPPRPGCRRPASPSAAVAGRPSASRSITYRSKSLPLRSLLTYAMRLPAGDHPLKRRK